MKPMTRIATAAAALALFVAPATFASEDTSKDARCRGQDTGGCACMTGHTHGTEPEKKAAQPSTPDYPIFTDQG
jgi:hypothetical protein